MRTIEDINTIKSVINEDFTIIVAKTKTCSTCKMITAHLKNTINNFESLNIYEVFVDEVDEFRGEYVVFSVPTVLVFSNGKELLRESRFIDTNKINRLIDNYQS